MFSVINCPDFYSPYLVAAYTACKRSAIKPGQWIVLSGAAGSLGHFAVQYVKTMGMRVIAVDGGDEKRDLCKRLGAEAFIDFATTKGITAEIMRITTYSAHGVAGNSCNEGVARCRQVYMELVCGSTAYYLSILFG